MLLLSGVVAFAQKEKEQKELFAPAPPAPRPTVEQLYQQGVRFNSPVWQSDAAENLSQTEKLFRAGQEITQVNGKDVHAYTRRVIRPYLTSSTEQNRLMKQYSSHFLVLKKGSEIALTLVGPRQQPFTRKVTCNQSYLDALLNSREFTHYERPDGIAYVSLDYFDHPSIVAKFDSIYPQLKKAKALVLDLRRNGGGNSSMGWQIMARLTNRDFPMVKWETRNYRPTERAWGNAQSWYGDQYTYRVNMTDTTDYFHGPVVVLTSPETNSAAEDFLSIFTPARRGLLIGEPSASSTGQPLITPLPGQGLLVVCTKRDRRYDGMDWVGKGFQPDVPVSQTLVDFYKGRDTVLEKAFVTLKNPIKPIR